MVEVVPTETSRSTITPARNSTRTSRNPPAPVAPTSFGSLLQDLPADTKSVIRNLEKILYKINAVETAIVFNTTCINEGLLPRNNNNDNNNN